MADVKFSGLTVGTSPIADEGSLLAISEYDGVSTYTSKSYTLTEFRDIIYVMEAEDKFTFDSSGTNKVFADDTNSDAKIYFNVDGNNDVSLGTGIPYDTTPFIQVSTNDANIGTGGTNGNIFAYFDGSGATDSASLSLNDGAADHRYYEVVDNRAGNKTTLTQDAYGIAIGSNGATFNSGVTNAVIAGGVGITADKDDYLFTGKHELQLATEDFSFEDAGSTSATEQDWIEVSVGGVTGYIRVFATK